MRFPWAPRLTERLRQVRWRAHLGSALVALGVFVGVQAWQTRDVPTGAAPDFSLPLAAPAGAGGPHGQAIRLSEWRATHPGQAVAVHLWSDWCPFCRAEASSVSRVAADWPVLTVASRSGDATQVARTLTQQGWAWTTAVDPHGDVARSYGLPMVPVWLVVDPQGRISSVATGYTTELGMRARLWWAQHKIT